MTDSSLRQFEFFFNTSMIISLLIRVDTHGGDTHGDDVNCHNGEYESRRRHRDDIDFS